MGRGEVVILRGFGDGCTRCAVGVCADGTVEDVMEDWIDSRWRKFCF